MVHESIEEFSAYTLWQIVFEDELLFQHVLLELHPLLLLIGHEAIPRILLLHLVETVKDNSYENVQDKNISDNDEEDEVEDPIGPTISFRL